MLKRMLYIKCRFDRNSLEREMKDVYGGCSLSLKAHTNKAKNTGLDVTIVLNESNQRTKTKIPISRLFVGFLLILFGVMILISFVYFSRNKNQIIRGSGEEVQMIQFVSHHFQKKIFFIIDVKVHLKNNHTTILTLNNLGWYLKHLAEFKITNIIICDSELDDSLEGNNYENLVNLVPMASKYNISINIALDVLFSIKKSADATDNITNIYLRDDENHILEKYQRHILNSNYDEYELNIKNKIKKYNDANITDYIIFNLPPRIEKIKKKENAKHNYEYNVLNEVDNDLLLRTSKLITSTSLKINLYYSYEIIYERVDIPENIYKYSGSVVFISLDIFKIMMRDSNLFTRAFGFTSNNRRNILFFDISNDQFKFKINMLFLGVYLFSPKEIILSSGGDWFECFFVKEYYLNTNNIKLLTQRRQLVRRKFWEIVKLKTSDKYFSNHSQFLSAKIYSQHVLVALAGITKINNKWTNKLVLIYCFGMATKINVTNLLNLTKLERVMLLFDNYNSKLSDVQMESMDIHLEKEQLTVLRVTLFK